MPFKIRTVAQNTEDNSWDLTVTRSTDGAMGSVRVESDWYLTCQNHMLGQLILLCWLAGATY